MEKQELARRTPEKAFIEPEEVDWRRAVMELSTADDSYKIAKCGGNFDHDPDEITTQSIGCGGHAEGVG